MTIKNCKTYATKKEKSWEENIRNLKDAIFYVV